MRPAQWRCTHNATRTMEVYPHADLNPHYASGLTHLPGSIPAVRPIRENLRQRMSWRWYRREWRRWWVWRRSLVAWVGGRWLCPLCAADHRSCFAHQYRRTYSRVAAASL
jgi:hypothetical protein